MVPEKGMPCVVLALKICELLHKVTQPKYGPGERSWGREKGTASLNQELILLYSCVT